MCLKEGLRERDWSTDTLLAKDNLGPQVGPPLAKTRETSCEERELSSSEDLELRKLVKGWGFGASGDQAQDNVDGEGREDEGPIPSFIGDLPNYYSKNGYSKEAHNLPLPANNNGNPNHHSSHALHTNPLWDLMLPPDDPFYILEETPLSFPKSIETLALARCDWKEIPISHVITLDVPGLTKEDIKITVEKNRVLRLVPESLVYKSGCIENGFNVDFKGIFSSSAVLSVFLATLIGFGGAMSGISILREFLKLWKRWRARSNHQQGSQEVTQLPESAHTPQTDTQPVT
ncbi:hypothetical protein TEA_003621 [Camellia sinensis var. sinensis]|uniref:SHSP domain-containing protein n=1 Tax=Camellia sinensis var. sinensis TaxID=542762 RepID=A0A4S4E2X3_CAMSN|nr:hypothetical protein TEA_003621 [Camellia sinensis var. sinensis]